MIELILVRHGQASYLEGDYDRLSALGQRQARKLGEYWAARNFPIGMIFSGPAQRHIRTAEIVAEACRAGGKSWPDFEILDEFDEFPGEQVLRILGRILAERYPHIQKMADAFGAAHGKAERIKTLDPLFHEVARHWVAGEVSSPEVESWKQFGDRVRRGVEVIRRRGGDATRIVVFTSGGPTAVVALLALGIPDQNTLDLAFSPRNASYSEFFLEGSRPRLSVFNAHPHLEEAELLTCR